jgi:lactoylglutathione lyase
MPLNRRVALQGATALLATPVLPTLATSSANTKESQMNALHAIRHLDYVVLFARDMPAMRQFYSEVLGFELQRELMPQWVEYRVGASLLALTEHGLMFNDAKTPIGALSAMLAFRVAPAEVNACAAELKAKGIALVSEPTDQPWGHRTMFVRDPDGNVVEIYADI